MDYLKIETFDEGGDVLLVLGTVAAPTEDDPQATRVVEVRGWVSATTNHLPADAYCDPASCALAGPEAQDGGTDHPHLVEGAGARAMTAQEARDYCQRLLDAEAAPAPAPKPLALF